MDRPKLMLASMLIDRASEELNTALEKGGLDEYDYDDSIRLANKLILEAQEFVLAFYDEVAPYDKGV